MKKLLCAVCCFCLLAGLWGCGKDKPADTSSSDTSSSVTPSSTDQSNAASSQPAGAVLGKDEYTYGDTVETIFEKGDYGLYNAWIGAVPASIPHTEAASQADAGWQTELTGNGKYTAEIDDRFFVGDYEMRAYSAGEEIACAPFTVVDVDSIYGAPLNVSIDAGATAKKNGSGQAVVEEITLSFNPSAQAQGELYRTAAMSVDIRLRVDGGAYAEYNIMQYAYGRDAVTQLPLVHQWGAMEQLSSASPEAYEQLKSISTTDGLLDLANHTLEVQLRYSMMESKGWLTLGPWTTPVGLGLGYSEVN